MLSDAKTNSRSIKYLNLHLHVSVQEKWSGIAMLLAKVEDAVQCTAVVTSCPFLDKVTDIDNIRVWSDWNRHPALGRRVPDLKSL
jgi:hypothetical protein